MLGAIRDFIKTCPYLKGKININYLAPKPFAYSISPTGEHEVIKRYSDGGRIMGFYFNIDFRLPYSNEVEKQKEYYKVICDFSDWLNNQNLSDVDLALQEDINPISIKTISMGALVSNEANSAHYRTMGLFSYYIY